jgi:hypothetical protein
VAAPSIDVSRLPVVVVRFSGLATDAEFDEYLVSMTRLIVERKQKSVTILDARQSGRSPATQRKKQAAWISAHENLLRQYSLGTAFVITSPLVRGVLTAILWLQPLPSDYTVVGTMAEAERWAHERLRSAGLGTADSTEPT